MARQIFMFERGKSFKNLSPQIIGEELERIRAAHDGVLKPEHVLEAATPEDSILHACFTWDDAEAAHKRRLDEARKVVTCVRIITPASPTPLRAFVSVRTAEHGRGYLPTTEALSDEEMRTRLLVEARQMVESLERRYAHLKGVADVLERLRQAAG